MDLEKINHQSLINLIKKDRLLDSCQHDKKCLRKDQLLLDSCKKITKYQLLNSCQHYKK